MTKRVITTWVAISLGFLAAAPAHAEIGSVISSFRLGPYYDEREAYRSSYADTNYVYAFYKWPSNNQFLRAFYKNGARSFSKQLDVVRDFLDTSHTHLGPGYLAVGDRVGQLIRIYGIYSGPNTPVASFSTSPNAPSGLFWDGTNYYVGTSSRGYFRRYSRYGTYAGVWICGGLPSGWARCYESAYAQAGNKTFESYFVTVCPEEDEMCMTTFPGGSLVKTWSFPYDDACSLVYADSSQYAVYGAAIWAGVRVGGDLYAFEYDIDARGASSVVPASLGKVKVLYR